MILYINTTNNTDIEVALKEKGQLLCKKVVKTNRDQAEKLLPLVEKILKENKKQLKNIKGIEVKNSGGSFTSLRIGVVTANALGFALNIPVKGEKGKRGKIVQPIYNREPDIK